MYLPGTNRQTTDDTDLEHSQLKFDNFRIGCILEKNELELELSGLQ